MPDALEKELKRALTDALADLEVRASAEASDALEAIIRIAAERNGEACDDGRPHHRVVSDFTALVHAMAEVSRDLGDDALTDRAVDRVLLRACPLFPFC